MRTARATRTPPDRRRPATGLPNPRELGDPPADRLVASLERSELLAEVDTLLARVARNDDPLPTQLPPAVRQFLDAEGVPAWADLARIRRAQAFADRNAFAITSALFCAALPTAFAGAKGAAVLALTRRLHDDVDRRVNETGRYVFDVLAPGGLAAGGRGVRSTQKVRLVHAAVRRMAAHATTTPRSEVPINQEDLLGTLLCFSVVVLDALARLDVSVTDAEGEDFLHLWCVVGSMLGIRRELIPRDLREARRQAERIRGREHAPSAHGRALARVLIDGIERHLPLRGLGLVAPGVVRYLAGDAVGDVLALPSGIHAGDMRALVARLPSLGTGVLRAIPSLGRRAIDALLAVKLGQRPASFGTPLAMATPTCPWSGRTTQPTNAKVMP